MSAMKPATQQNTPVTDNPLSYAGYRFPPDVISYAVWLYYRFPLSLRMVEELLAARGIELTYSCTAVATRTRSKSERYAPKLSRPGKA
jgi:transposase-like protein